MGEWISIKEIENYPMMHESCIVNVCNREDSYCFTDIGRHHRYKGKMVWSTNLGLDEGEEITHFKINSDLKPIPFSEITDIA